MALFGTRNKTAAAGTSLDPERVKFINAHAKFIERCGMAFVGIADAIKSTRGEVTVEVQSDLQLKNVPNLRFAWMFKNYQQKTIILPYLHSGKKDQIMLTVGGMLTQYEKGLFLGVFEKTPVEVSFTNTLI